MTSPLGQAISDWLKRCPGCFDADTEDDVFAFAYENFPAKARFTVDEFRAGLDRAGYVATLHEVHGAGGGRSYMRLALPEGFGGV